MSTLHPFFPSHSYRNLAMEEDLDGDKVLYSPTWAIAAVCAVFILCSLAVERTIYHIGRAFKSHNHLALSAALEKIKEELMVVGFISLTLSVGQRNVSKVCVSRDLIDFMPQCKKPLEHARQDLSLSFKTTTFHQQVACTEGSAPFISLEGLHQLHILLFILAIVHIIYSIAIMTLGMLKVHQWKAWEERAHIADSSGLHGEIRFTRDVTFIRRHTTGLWSKNRVSAILAAFFQQFFRSVSEPDYLTLRHGFIKEHKLTGFNFYKYILKTMEDDFEQVVGISASLWVYMVLLTLLNVQGWGLYFWVSFIPLIIVLAVGTKLRHVITQMAVQYSEKHAVVEGLPDVKPTDEFFWFGRPRVILYLIHYILFQDALELSLHIWTMFEFSDGSCFYKQRYLLLGRLLLGVLAQLICGYVMLPLYALVSQMGSEMKGSDLYVNEPTQDASRRPHEEIQSKDDETSSKEIVETIAVLDPEHTPSPCIDHVNCKDLEKCPVGKQESDAYSIAGIDEDNGDHNTRNRNEFPHLQKKMSFVQRVAWGVQGADYHSLALLGSNEKPH